MSPVDKKTEKPTYWRSLAELENAPEFREFVEREFATPLDDQPVGSPGRRRFMQLMGASLALAGVSGCRWQEDHLLPYSRRPAGEIPGVPRSFATAMDLGGVATGLYVTSYDDRPIKVEGNPDHPGSHGTCMVQQQASVLNVYDPDRSQGVAQYRGQKRQDSSYARFDAFAKKHFAALRARGGKGLRILAEASSSPTVDMLKRRLLAGFPQAKWVEYEPISHDNEREGSRLAFGSPVRTQYALDKADVVVSLDADLVSQHRAAIPNARGLAEGRDPDRFKMSRVYAIESTLSLMGAMADHRLPLRSELIKAVAAALDADLDAQLKPDAEVLGTAQPKPKAAALADAKVAKFLSVVVKDLLANKGRSVVAVGSHQPPEVHAVVHRINAMLGNVGVTLSYTAEPDPARPPHVEALQALTAEMNGGQVDTLLILGGNPVYNAPSDVAFGAALGKVKTSIHLSAYQDETSRQATWHLNAAHYLESWGDARGYDGTISIVQPLIAPLYGGRSWIELLAMVLGETQKPLDIVKSAHTRRLGDPRKWRKAVADGVVQKSAWPTVSPKLKSIDPMKFTPGELGGAKAEGSAVEVLFTPDFKLYDGRFANNAWLQELADPVTKLTWENAALIAPATANALGIEESTRVKLSLDGQEITLPALYAPGQAEGSIRVALGYGRTTLGHVGGLEEDGVEPIGANTYKLRSTKGYHFAEGAKITPTGEKYRVGSTQHLWNIDKIGKDGEADRVDDLVREGKMEEFKENPGFAKEQVEHPPLLSLWVPPVNYAEGHKWGMSIDLSRCIGCNACMIACQAENNIPVVGKERVVMGREMNWIRVDRYYKGTPDEPEVIFQPVPCQQCENAPCESVCPVGATQHSDEGLNDMTYNRCIGTRYCSNNCPYKVRRFNFFNYHMEFKHGKNKVKAMAFNPDVTLRFRGVMEKCTYCVQRIQNVKIQAKNHKREIKDGEIKTACQQTCPTEAIVFGDLNDKSSKVAALHNNPRCYSLLVSLFTMPRTRYLARVKNPHPELG